MGDLKNGSLSQHNKYRKDHGAPPLKWSNKLQNNAQKWANELAKKNALQHCSQQEEGENLAYRGGKELSGSEAVDMWYDEIKDYKFNNPGFRSNTGHFTQVVWAGSQELGVGKAVSKSGSQFVVARYYPPGNNTKTFRENVFPSGSKPSANKANKESPAKTTSKPAKNKDKKSSGKSKNKSNDKNVKVTITTTTTTTTTKDGVTTTYKESSENEGPEHQSDKTFRNTVLKTHNNYRKRHAAAPLKWNSKLAKAAENAAQEAANTNTLRTVNMDNTGENQIARAQGDLPGGEVSSVWYNEESKYDYNSPGYSTATGKFSQIVWKETKEVGVGRAFGSQGQTFVVALYQPAGNARGKFEENVMTPTGPVPTGDGNGGGCSCVIL